MTNLREIQHVDTVPGSKVRDFPRRRRMVRPPDDMLGPAERLDDVASGKAGGARHENHTVHASMFSVKGDPLLSSVLGLVIRLEVGILFFDGAPPPLIRAVPLESVPQSCGEGDVR